MLAFCSSKEQIRTVRFRISRATPLLICIIQLLTEPSLDRAIRLLNFSLGVQIGNVFHGLSLGYLTYQCRFRNAALGLGDGSDRMYPDQVVLQRKEEHAEEKGKLSTRFSPILTRQIQMSKLHTGQFPLGCFPQCLTRCSYCYVREQWQSSSLRIW